MSRRRLIDGLTSAPVPVTATSALGVSTEATLHANRRRSLMVDAALASGAADADVVGAPRRDDTALMLGLCDPREVVRRLNVALARLAADRGVPADVAALVSEIETALADSGPLELGVPADVFVRGLEMCKRVRAGLDAADGVSRHRQIVRAVRKLRRVFRLAVRSARARERTPSASRAAAAFVVLAGGGALAPSAVLSGVLYTGALIPFVAAINAWHILKTRKARAVMAAATPGERLLLWHQPANVCALLRRRVWVATDRRLFFAERPRGDRPIQVLRVAEYPQISAFSCARAGESSTRLELRVSYGQLVLHLDTEEAEALLAILCERTGLPALHSSSGRVDLLDVERLTRRDRRA
jgi:hypothetical protein